MNIDICCYRGSHVGGHYDMKMLHRGIRMVLLFSLSQTSVFNGQIDIDMQSEEMQIPHRLRQGLNPELTISCLFWLASDSFLWASSSSSLVSLSSLWTFLVISWPLSSFWCTLLWSLVARSRESRNRSTCSGKIGMRWVGVTVAQLNQRSHLINSSFIPPLPFSPPTQPKARQGFCDFNLSLWLSYNKSSIQVFSSPTCIYMYV